MEFFGFRTEAVKNATRWRGDAISAFGAALRSFLEERHMPEHLLAILIDQLKLRTMRMGMIRYLTFSQTVTYEIRNGRRPAAGKTFLFPGAVWHNHNYTAVEAYLRDEERSAYTVTPDIPTEDEFWLGLGKNLSLCSGVDGRPKAQWCKLVQLNRLSPKLFKEVFETPSG